MLFVLSLATAAPLPPSTPAGESGSALRERLMAQVDRSTELPCQTELVEQLRLHWGEFTPAERAHASAVLAPNGTDLFAPAIPKWTGAAPPPAMDSCWSEYDNRLVGEHFVVEWQDGVDSDDAQQFLDDLETSWAVEVDELGWNPPSGSNQYLTLIVIQNKRTEGAYTSVKSCGGRYIPYIVSGKDSWDDPYWGASMAPHEFNHALQFGYSYAPEFWWWEATATYMEDNVFPNINYWGGYVAGYTMAPHIALSASSQSDQDVFWHMYGLAIFAFYLDNYQGGPETVLRTWQDSQHDQGQYDKSAKDMVEDLGLDWDTVYADWITKNTVMDYAQQRYFPEIDLHDEVRNLPADGKSKNGDIPQGYGQNYILFNGGLGKGDLVLTFTGDDRTEWAVELVEVQGDRVDRVVSGTTEKGAGVVTLTGYGEQDVYLVVSPLDAADDDFAYAWTAELVSAEPDDTGDTEDSGNPDGTGDTGANADGDSDVDASTGGCGCAVPGSAGMAGIGVLIAALAAGRRRA